MSGSVVLFIAASSVVAAGETTDMFPFVLSYDVERNITNISDWLPRPAGQFGFVRVRDGQFVTDRGRIRFWGTNLCFAACFPERKQAERLAERLARFGINVVRLHHMDARHIWGKSRNKLTIDPEQLDRLDYLIYQLKQHGIYTNINLHVSRWFGPAEGFPNREGRPRYDKGLDNFEPRMIELQKKYAKDLLTHRNPYTGNKYIEEPAVAFVEISNEDALFTVWKRGELDKLPEPYATTFRKLWNEWLRAKYKTTAALRAAWSKGEEPLGAELLLDTNFNSPLGKAWRMERDDLTKADWRIRSGGPDGGKILEIRVERQGRVSWRPQVTLPGLALKGGEPYTLSFWIRGNKRGAIRVNCMMAHAPWQQLGLSTQVPVRTEWRQHSFTFVAKQDDANARVTFSGLKPGTYEISGVSLRRGGVIGLPANQRLEDYSVAVLPSHLTGRTDQVKQDFIDFLWETEEKYWYGMYRYLKDELGVRSLVCGTQLSYSPVHVQAKLDYIDAHSYWQHPRFPGRPWDPANWYVENVALVNSPPGTLGSLAARRVAGLPYTVSEYNHPEPNEYSAEGFPMIAAFGAFQDWDGIYSFAYCHNDRFEIDRIDSYFDIKSHPAKLAHMVACAAMILRGDVRPARSHATATLTLDQERRLLYETYGNPRALTAEHLGVPPTVSLLHKVEISLTGGRRDLQKFNVPDDLFTSDTGELSWDVKRSSRGVFTVDTTRTKLVTGFVSGQKFELGKVQLAIGATRLGWATITLVCVDGEGFDQPGHILLTATGVVRNSGAKLQRLDGHRITFGRHWGVGPVLCEGVPLQVTIPVPPNKVRVYRLDESGGRSGNIPVASGRYGNSTISLKPEYRTIWYEIEILN